MSRSSSIGLIVLALVLLQTPIAAARQATEPAAKADQAKSASQLVAEGMQAYAAKEYRKSAELLEAAIAHGAKEPDVFYNAACSSALAGDKEKAFGFLDRAIAAGFRSDGHLKADTDLASLHDDPRWADVVAACERKQRAYLEEHRNPDRTRFVTEDIDRFWRAYDLALAAPKEERAAILEREYIEPGSIGLKDFARSGRLNAKGLAAKIAAYPNFFKAIRTVTSGVASKRDETLAAFRKLKSIYPDAMFPDAYFVVGQLQSGGTASDNGLLMGAEMFARTADLPTSELSDWERGAISEPSDIPPLVTHESIHFQQRFPSERTLLNACLREGGADFVSRLAAGRMIDRMEETHRWANARERELWEEFRTEMDGQDVSRWLYGSSGGNGRPVDLGYWMGYKICEAYYEQAADKQQAIRDILVVTDTKKFLEASGYAKKFEGEKASEKAGEMTARPEDIGSIDGIVKAFYETISGPKGQPRQWDRDRTLYRPGIRFVALSERDGKIAASIMAHEDYVARTNDFFVQNGFFEREIHREVQRFGNMAHVWSTYETRATADGPVTGRGINSIQLYHDGARWWITAVTWDDERENARIPKEYLGSE